ncbi:MAG: hypothetical protein QOG10_5913 [Kribbellaceae bacterium]|jgi:hypothetical protein|nr:hypothetical protein [Kribbellaceae bacterium]
MTATATLPGSASTTLRIQRVLRAMLIGLRPMLVGYWLLMVAGFLLVGVTFQVVTGVVDHSMWDYGTQSPKYFSAAIGITMTPAFFTVLVAHGVTRRMFAVASSIYLVGAAASTALVWVLVYQVEHALYAWQGWTQTLANPHLFTKTSQVGLVFTEFFLLILSHEVAGWLIGTSFYRFGFWKGLAMLPLGLVPAIAAEFLLVAQWLAQALQNTGYHRPPLAIAVPGVLLVSALGLYAVYLLLRPIGIKPARG